eukprot:CAMPEP_0117046258 /NCGR_PEP_ID=MMETSP0472-20121206/31991_1 /TAXON_ID=693140 ORGANISM="Tiarina fusus, Strain LIS" /NCGR_SAMPLE_ID=MMETSP0472 /ASSEMBLY_ACC=CAM_ASM_000603 /LENGTH=61 /DNA_ID=CAMNT_0004758553 /DNA_START=86 /DNA_END=271 /DNA_ORIENTATION=-
MSEEQLDEKMKDIPQSATEMTERVLDAEKKKETTEAKQARENKDPTRVAELKYQKQPKIPK